MKLKQVMLAAGVVLTAPAYAAIANGSSGNGELFLSVYDDDTQISYTLDLGARQNDFFVAAQSDAGYTKTWVVDDSNWQDFFQKKKEMVWTVLASETSGGTAAGGNRLFTTVKVGDESMVGTFSNQLFTNATGTSQLGTFFSAINNTGTHGTPGVAPDFAINGNSSNAASDPGNAFFGIPGSGPTLNGNAPFSSGNEVGTKSSFFYLTRSGSNQAGMVLVDQFDNAAFKGSFVFSGGDVADPNGRGYNLTYTLQPVPEPGTYALMLLGLGALAYSARRRAGR